MSDELSRKICAYFEPEPLPQNLRDTPLGWKWWKLEQRWAGGRFDYRVVPVDCMTPEITLRLLKFLLERDTLTLQELAGCWLVKSERYAHEEHSLEEAIARAVERVIDSTGLCTTGGSCTTGVGNS
jgi:hypothetical protein